MNIGIGGRELLRHRALGLAVWLGSVVLLGRAFQLQILEGSDWRARALAQHERRVVLPAPRGSLFDRAGRPLALSRETYAISVAPGELRNRAAAKAALRDVLGLLPSAVSKAVDPGQRWVVLPGRYSPVEKERLESLVRDGVYFEPTLERFYPFGELAAGLIGRVSSEGVGQAGVEFAFDSLLAGRPGYGVRRRDATGAAQSLTVPAVLPSRGNDLVLTLDLDLQAIAEEALDGAIAATGAEGGEVLIVDPRTGDLLAAVSRRPGAPRALAALSEPYEPGSTLKPLIAAALLAERKASLEDVVDTEGGEYRLGRRVIRDVHRATRLTFREVLTFSSNIGLVKFAERLESSALYAYLRDFGFGTPTGVWLPGESPGRLRRPAEWSGLSQASVAMGYEVAVTPLQLAMAYAAIANGGNLVRPRVVREVRDPSGRTLWRSEPEVVRRVIPERVARTLRSVLAEAVSEGTGKAARVAGISIAGKTGTAHRFDPVTGYAGARYTASFVGLIPADAPEWVVLVKLDDPRGAHYGGETAAPVMRLAVRAALAGTGGPASPPLGEPVLPDAMAGVTAGQAPATGPYIFALDRPLVRLGVGARENSEWIRVPDVRGMSLRAAARHLHNLGLKVGIAGFGRVLRTEPEAGTEVPRGAILVVVAGPPHG